MSDGLFDPPCPVCGGTGLNPRMDGDVPCYRCLPVLPYNKGTSSGHSGTDTSRERANRRDRGGKTSENQAFVLRVLRDWAGFGITVAELRDAPEFGGHHGTASGVLSNLHQKGIICRLMEKRDGCRVYVLPEFVNGRDWEPYQKRRVAS